MVSLTLSRDTVKSYPNSSPGNLIFLRKNLLVPFVSAQGWKRSYEEDCPISPNPNLTSVHQWPHLYVQSTCDLTV